MVDRTHFRSARAKARPRRRSKVGTAPGLLIADPNAAQPTLHVIAYGPDRVTEFADCTMETALAARGQAPMVWIDVAGLGDAELIASIGEAFGLHRLALEDVVDVHERPKVETYEDHLFVILRMLDTGREPATEQLALFVGAGFLISFQERAGDCLEPVRERLRHGRGRLRVEGADYLAYALIDGVIDAYFPMLEHYGEVVDTLEDAVVAEPRREQVTRLYRVKRDLLMLRRAVWPTRDLLNAMLRDENPLLTSHTRLFLRDAYDHTVQLMDLVETYREITTGLLDVYLSSQSARMNEIMKFLTIIATIFIPLGFLASLWGMNFDRAAPWNMPELGWRFGYPAAIAVMIAVGAGLLIYFRRKGWLDAGADRIDDDPDRREGEGARRG